MYTDINNEIYDLTERLRAKEKLVSQKDMLINELERKTQIKDQLYKQLMKEKEDVEKLEGLSFSSIFLSILGKKEDKLDKEREEFLAAELRYEESLESIKELHQEIKKLNNELEDFADVKDRYNKLIKEKERLLLNDNSSQGRRLREGLDHINQIKLDIKEVDEAIYAGERAVLSLEEMKKHLDSARGWGTWDMLGGGLISDLAKHSAIDKANNAAHNVQYLLKSFEKELSDVNKFTDIKVNLSGFATFADFFFDGFFVDWFVQSKIKDSLRSVEGALSRISSILGDLRKNSTELNNVLRVKEEEVKVILEN
ncbi:MAG: hypothetical protein RIN55_09790 [Tissierellaceae bacterium]|nr:hypothetical protein [Tissierellaceae bacterium]